MPEMPLMPGDVIPALALPGSDGALHDLFHQSIAGFYRVLLLGEGDMGPGLHAAAKRAEQRHARLFTISSGMPDGRSAHGVTRLFDPERRMAKALALEGGGVVTLSPRGRIAFLRGGGSALREALEALPESEPASPVSHGGAPVLIVPDVLEPKLCETMIAFWRQGRKTRDKVASSQAGAAALAGTGIKRRTDVVLDDRALYGAFRQRLERRVLPELMRAFRFQPASFEAPRLGCYAAADRGAFGAHRDNRTRFTQHRRFAMSLNLNTGAYEGGTLRFPEFGEQRYEPMAGGAAIFSCDLLHEAMPVTRGERFALFTFMTDTAGAQQERRMIAERQAAGELGVEIH